MMMTKSVSTNTSRMRNITFPGYPDTIRASIPIDSCSSYDFFFFNDTATTEIYTVMNTLSLHDALPIFVPWQPAARRDYGWSMSPRSEEHTSELQSLITISYAVFCLKKKKNISTTIPWEFLADFELDEFSYQTD